MVPRGASRRGFPHETTKEIQPGGRPDYDSSQRQDRDPPRYNRGSRRGNLRALARNFAPGTITSVVHLVEPGTDREL